MRAPYYTPTGPPQSEKPSSNDNWDQDPLLKESIPNTGSRSNNSTIPNATKHSTQQTFGPPASLPEYGHLSTTCGKDDALQSTPIRYSQQ